jgi:hypothetical protein
MAIERSWGLWLLPHPLRESVTSGAQRYVVLGGGALPIGFTIHTIEFARVANSTSGEKFEWSRREIGVRPRLAGGRPR